MIIDGVAFRAMVRDFCELILAREPPAGTDAEKLVVDFLGKCDEDGVFEQKD